MNGLHSIGPIIPEEMMKAAIYLYYEYILQKFRIQDGDLQYWDNYYKAWNTVTETDLAYYARQKTPDTATRRATVAKAFSA